MNKKGKQLLGLLLAVLLVVSLVPMSAFALTSGAEVKIDHLKMSNKVIGEGFDPEIDMDLKPEDAKKYGDFFTTSDSGKTSYSLYVPTEDMTEEYKAAYKLPYFKDKEGNIWYLYQVLLSNKKSPTDEGFGEEENIETLISSDDIQTLNSKEDYTVDFSKYEMNVGSSTGLGGVTKSVYYVLYCWTPYAPDNWDNIGDGPAETYSVEYDLNLPKDAELVFPVMYDADSKRNYIRVTDGGTNEDVLLNEVGELKKESILEGLNFKLAEGFDYVGFLVIDSEGIGWEFEGWEGENGVIYEEKEPGQPVKIQATSDLAGEDTAIKFTGAWKKIDAKSEAELADAPKVLLLATNNNQGVVTQWTDKNETPTTDEITISEDDVLYYQAEVMMEPGVAFVLDNKQMWNDGFATFEIQINVADNLKPAGDAKTLTAEFVCPFLEPTALRVDGEEVEGFQVSSVTETGVHTITVNRTDLTNDDDGTIKDFVIETKWWKDKGSATYNELIQPMTLTSFGLQWAGGEAEEYTVTTSGEVRGTIDFSVTNPRVKYQAAYGMLTNRDGEWAKFFGTNDDPAALFNATQYLVEKLEDNENTYLTANPVEAHLAYTIDASAGSHGSIAPQGLVTVKAGESKTFKFTPETGYQVNDVVVDGKSVGAVNSYTFKNVIADHTITVTFEKKSSPPVIIVPPDDDDQPEDPDDTGVSDLLNTKDHDQYLFGYPDGTFGPRLNMTRAEAAQMFYNLLVDQDVEAPSVFDDVPEGAWYAEPVNVMAKLGIVKGVGDDKFEPDREITRAEFTAMAMRFAQGETSGKNIFSDVDEDDWFYDVVVDSIKYGWIEGYPDGTFRPQNLITREEVTTIVNRMLGRLPDEKFIDAHEDDLDLFPDVTKNWAYYDVVEATNDHQYKKTSSGEDWTKLG